MHLLRQRISTKGKGLYMVRGDDVETTRTPLTILTCSVCGRSVKVFGKVRRVLCACGQTLFEHVPALPASPPARPGRRKTRGPSSIHD